MRSDLNKIHRFLKFLKIRDSSFRSEIRRIFFIWRQVDLLNPLPKRAGLFKGEDLYSNFAVKGNQEA